MTEFNVLTAEEQVANVLAADARRVGRQGFLVGGVWLLSVLAAMGQVFLHVEAADRAGLSADQLAARVIVLGLTVGLPAAAGPALLLLLWASRQASLRQIQASLAAIAGQLAEVQRGRGTMPPTAGG